MDKTSKCIEVRSPEGTLLLSLHFCEVENGHTDKRNNSGSPASDQPQNGTGSNSQSDQPPMTEAQKRYLFRIMADQGLENDHAHQHLKKLFGVETLQDVSKREASRMIERLVEEAEKKK